MPIALRLLVPASIILIYGAVGRVDALAVVGDSDNGAPHTGDSGSQVNTCYLDAATTASGTHTSPRLVSLSNFSLCSNALIHRDLHGQWTIPPVLIMPIGIKIWFNECNASDQQLVYWNKGESFMALGIGHFIWHPQGSGKGSWQQGFPKLLRYLAAHGASLPEWLRGKRGLHAPWATRQEFISVPRDIRLLELRKFLRAHLELQARFLVEDLFTNLPRMLEVTPEEDRAIIMQHFCRLATLAQGLYVMIDYLNFKGPGVHPSRQNYYRGSGLLQVLREMQYAPPGYDPIQAFVYAAKIALARRVENSHGKYQQWLTGWYNRLNSYLEN